MPFSLVRKAAQFYATGRKLFTQTGYQKAHSDPTLYERWAAVDDQLLSRFAVDDEITKTRRGDREMQEFLYKRRAAIQDSVYIVTGANSGLGREISKYLIKAGAGRVYMVCRNKERCNEARDQILEEAAADIAQLYDGPALTLERYWVPKDTNVAPTDGRLVEEQTTLIQTTEVPSSGQATTILNNKDMNKQDKNLGEASEAEAAITSHTGGEDVLESSKSNTENAKMACKNKKLTDKSVKRLTWHHLIKPDSLRVIGGIDCGLRADIDRAWKIFTSQENRLDGLVCNAGALSNELSFTDEDIETTLATHLIFGSYYLGYLALPWLRDTNFKPERSKGERDFSGRLVFVSSGGMLNTKFPGWKKVIAKQDAKDKDHKKYNGQLQYAYAKRGQVILAEHWAHQEPEKKGVSIVSCHPGWVDTPGVDAAYGSNKKYLKPMRSMWEGVAGICWLLLPKPDNILSEQISSEKARLRKGGSFLGRGNMQPDWNEREVSGEFYLDTMPQSKHLSGLLIGDALTKNTDEEQKEFMRELEEYRKASPQTTEEN